MAHRPILPLALASLCLMHTTASQAEELEMPRNFELDVTGGYRFGGNISVDEDGLSGNKGELSIDTAPSYGGILGYRVQPNGLVYLSYSRQQTTVRYRESGSTSTTASGDAAIEYLQFGGNLEGHSDRFYPYLGFSIGAARFSTTKDSSDEFRFSVALDGGVKIELLPFLHLRILGRLPVTFTSGDSRSLCFTGAGCVVVLSDTPLIQGEAHGGLGLDF